MAVIYLAAGNVLPLSQRTESARPANLKPQTVQNHFFLQDYVSYTIKPIHIHIRHYLWYDQQVGWNPKYFRLIDSLALTQDASKIPPQQLQDFLTFTQEARIVLYEILADVLTFSHSVEVTRGFSQVLTFIDEVAFTISRVLQFVDTLTFTQGVTVHKSNDPNFISNPEPAPAFPPPPGPDPQPRNVTLSIGATSIDLPAPDFGDTNEILHHRINRRTRAGELIIYKDSQWPIIETLSYRFHGLSELKAKQVLNFLNATLGLTISMIDYRGVPWSVIITNPDAEARQDSGQNPCANFSIELDFEGTRV